MKTVQGSITNVGNYEGYWEVGNEQRQISGSFLVIYMNRDKVHVMFEYCP